MRTFFVLGAIMVVTCVYAVAVMAHMFLFREPAVFHLYARWWSRILLRLAGIRVVMHGADLLRAHERYVYVANHASLFDIPVVLATIPDNVRIMYKRELERIPVFGWCLKMSPFIAIDRGDGRDAMAQLEKTVESLRDGASVLVFPEGTRSPDGRMVPFKRGAFILAARSGKPLIPLTIVGTHGILPAGTRHIRPGTVHLYVHPPVRLEGTPNRAQENEAMSEVWKLVAERVTSPV